MRPRARMLVLLLVTALALGGAGAYALSAYLAYQHRVSGPSQADVAVVLPQGPHVLFRNTAAGTGYGMVASVPLADPAGPRSLTDMPCDRVYRAAGTLSCMRTVRGVPTRFEEQVYDAAGARLGAWPLAGIPSRTRVSADGLVATTAFVTGHSYAGDAFSTETVIRSADGRDLGNLEDFTASVDDRELTAVDRNVWGVTFAADAQTFYATVASGGQTWLMRGSLSDRTLRAVASNAECPSLSPDGRHIAYKKRRGATMPVHWDIAVLDLATHKEQLIRLPNGLDDQLEWLDDRTLLFGQPRPNAVGDSDVWRLDAAAGSTPELFIEHAWSPSVQRR